MKERLTTISGECILKGKLCCPEANCNDVCVLESLENERMRLSEYENAEDDGDIIWFAWYPVATPPLTSGTYIVHTNKGNTFSAKYDVPFGWRGNAASGVRFWTVLPPPPSVEVRAGAVRRGLEAVDR